MGAWIETGIAIVPIDVNGSHPTWVRGLKQLKKNQEPQHFHVAPYVGAWIETLISSEYILYKSVAPYVGAWIETSHIFGE